MRHIVFATRAGFSSALRLRTPSRDRGAQVRPRSCATPRDPHRLQSSSAQCHARAQTLPIRAPRTHADPSLRFPAACSSQATYVLTPVYLLWDTLRARMPAGPLHLANRNKNGKYFRGIDALRETWGSKNRNNWLENQRDEGALPTGCFSSNCSLR